jgi:hypothetical protein
VDEVEFTGPSKPKPTLKPGATKGH